MKRPLLDGQPLVIQLPRRPFRFFSEAVAIEPENVADLQVLKAFETFRSPVEYVPHCYSPFDR